MVFHIDRNWASPPSFHIVPDLITAEECARLIARTQELSRHETLVKPGDHTYRDTDVFWLEASDPQNGWIFHKLRDAVLSFNATTYRFEIDSCSDLQLGRYRVGQHYDWHCDLGGGGYSTRKLSLSLLLSDQAAYEGGELEFGVGNYTQKVTAPKGGAVLFPSWMGHRVTPVTRGERWSLVGWWLGPPFR